MGIPGSLFFRPRPTDPFGFTRYGRYLETPIGVAAGPHTQLAQNIIAAWLCGARYIELKTIQTLDELEVSKPCIDMQDEGFNCEWSQELKVKESFTEYMNAWIIIHVLRRELRFPGQSGTLFNMSVGYNLDGIMNANVQDYFRLMLDCTDELAIARKSIRSVYPEIDAIDIPSRISDHVTLSTMHGCPPEEIEKIGLYLIREKKLHTTIKLNPTLLGAEELRELLNNRLGFKTVVPDQAFGHDLKYPEALQILESLEAASAEHGLQFGVKLTNTLETENNKGIFSPGETMMYMSGRALHPLSISLARKIQNDLAGGIDISFSAGIDCFNVAEVLGCGMKPVTVCSDLLKPGGYGRLFQYIENLRSEFALKQADDLDTYILKVAGSGDSPQHAANINLNKYADRVAGNPAYHKHLLSDPSIKTSRSLGWFDCIHAPCIDTCPANQDIPEYMYYTSIGNYQAAFEAIFTTNPFPSVTGMVCDHLCQFKCTRINYDDALHIREIKRFVAENAPPPAIPRQDKEDRGKVAIIGAGPAGLSCGWFLRNAGFGVDIFEQKNLAGGMVSAAIPSFRLTSQAIETDIQRILSTGIRLHDNQTIDGTRFEKLYRDYDAVFLATGAQKQVKLNIDGIGSAGVIDPLEFLSDVRKLSPNRLGHQVVIIGGGNTAMDAARTAYRLVGEAGTVTIIYRRTIREMPADHGEIEAVLDEGIRIMELTKPVRVITIDGRVSGLVCSRNQLTGKGTDGRLLPVNVPGTEFELSCDTVIPAIGQQLAIEFLEADQLITLPGRYKTRIPGVYIGGDAMRGASTAINAIADGRKAAAEIIADTSQLLPSAAMGGIGDGISKTTDRKNRVDDEDIKGLLQRKSIREYGYQPAETAMDQRRNFDLIISSMSAAEAGKEAARCLQCGEICNVCISVCPNLANFGYRIEPVSWLLQKAVLKNDGTIAFEPDTVFRIGQQFQILNIRDLCNECGNCTTFCPSSGRPFTDKPGICLSEKSFDDEETGFYYRRSPEGSSLVCKKNKNISTLSLANGNYLYETDEVRAVIRAHDFNLLEVRFLAPGVKEASFSLAAEMSIVMKGVLKYMMYDSDYKHDTNESKKNETTNDLKLTERKN